MTRSVTAYIGIGANLGEPWAQCRQAVDQLRQHAEVRVTAVSTLRETTPVGPVAQDRFVNGVVAIETACDPRALLQICLQIERHMGRVRGQRWGPRCIDLDVLLYGDLSLEEPGLCIPHPQMTRRWFVMEPLAEIAPTGVYPHTGERFAVLAAALAPDHRMEPVG